MTKQTIETEKHSTKQRLDKWLWYARATKTRTIASTLIQSGKVRVNRQRTNKPGYIIKINDVITIAIWGGVRILQVLTPGSRRGPAVEAAQLYKDLTPVDNSLSSKQTHTRLVNGKGKRPTKRDRRAIDRFRSSNFE